MKKTCPKINFPLPFSRLGFTLIELLISISIVTIVLSLGISQYMKFNRQQILRQATLKLKNDLVYAQNMALAGEKTCTGIFDGILVEFTADGYRILSSCNNNDATMLIGSDPYAKLPVALSGGTPILFKPLTGGTDLTSDRTITLTLTGFSSTTVVVSRIGKIQASF